MCVHKPNLAVRLLPAGGWKHCWEFPLPLFPGVVYPSLNHCINSRAGKCPYHQWPVGPVDTGSLLGVSWGYILQDDCISQVAVRFEHLFQCLLAFVPFLLQDSFFTGLALACSRFSCCWDLVGLKYYIFSCASLLWMVYVFYVVFVVLCWPRVSCRIGLPWTYIVQGDLEFWSCSSSPYKLWDYMLTSPWYSNIKLTLVPIFSFLQILCVFLCVSDMHHGRYCSLLNAF